MRCSRGSGLLVRDTNLERHVAASNCEYEDCKKKYMSIGKHDVFSSWCMKLKEKYEVSLTVILDHFRNPALHNFKKVEFLHFLFPATTGIYSGSRDCWWTPPGLSRPAGVWWCLWSHIAACTGSLAGLGSERDQQKKHTDINAKSKLSFVVFKHLVWVLSVLSCKTPAYECVCL